MLRKIQHVHFVGIGGSGMSGIAEVLLNLGYAVSGSDLEALAGHRPARVASARGCSCGHAAEQRRGGARGGDLHRGARATTPRCRRPAATGCRSSPGPRCWPSSCASSTGWRSPAATARRPPPRWWRSCSTAAGSTPRWWWAGGSASSAPARGSARASSWWRRPTSPTARSSSSRPTIAVVTNIDREHLDTYRDLADIQDAFLGFVNKVPFYGGAVLCLDDPPVQDILPRVERRVVTYGLSHPASVSARDLELLPTRSSYTATLDGRALGEVTLGVPGAHNVANSLAAVAVGLDLEVPFAAIQAGLESFTGVDRRFQERGEAEGVLVIDDYGHHPTEIRVTLETLRRRAGERRTVVLFQPHRFTRTRALWDDFAAAFDQADLLLLTDIYPASEEEIPGVSAEALARAIAERGHRHAEWAGDLKAATEHLAAVVREGDVVLTLGAGNVWTAGESSFSGGARDPARPRSRADARGSARDRRRRSSWSSRTRLVRRRVAVPAPPPAGAGAAAPPRRGRPRPPRGPGRRGRAPRARGGVDGVAAGLRERPAAGGEARGAREPLPLRGRGARARLGPAVGENILALDIDGLKARLRASPWVADATVVRALPDTVRVEIRERVPLALAELERLYLMDEDGGAHRHLRPAHGGLRPPDRARAARRRGGVAPRPRPPGGGSPRRPRRARERGLRGVRGALGRPARGAARGRARCCSSATRPTASGS